MRGEVFGQVEKAFSAYGNVLESVDFFTTKKGSLKTFRSLELII